MDNKTFLVTRHPGALAWARANNIHYDHHREHVDVSEVGSGDTVIGTLPINMAAAICERGARYLHLSLDLPAEARGRELGADELAAYGAKLEEFRIQRVPPAN